MREEEIDIDQGDAPRVIRLCFVKAEANRVF